MENNEDKDVKQCLDISSLVGLKAELFKRREAFKQAKSQVQFEPQKRKVLKPKRDDVVKKVDSKGIKFKPSVEINEEEEEILKKSRLALEAKAKLYDEIVLKKVALDDEESENYMVDFSRKLLHLPEIKSDCHTKDPSSISDDSQTCENNKPDNNSKHSLPPYEMHANVHTEMSVVKPKNDSTGNTDGPVHYQNILHNEVRNHGVGYFAFSESEQERTEQLERLNALRQQTQEKRSSWDDLQRKRKALLQSRLAKICKRKNINETVITEYIPEEQKTVDSYSTEDEHHIDLSEIPLPESIPDTETKPTKVRPWDIGKDFTHAVNPPRKIVSQSSWIDNKREERLDEFAPPSFY